MGIISNYTTVVENVLNQRWIQVKNEMTYHWCTECSLINKNARKCLKCYNKQTK